VVTRNVAAPLLPRPRRDRSPGHSHAAAVVLAAAVVVAVASLAIVLAPGAQAPAGRPAREGAVTPHPVAPAPVRAELTIPARAHWIRVPPSFLGLSTEYLALPDWTRRVPVATRVLSLLHVAGDAPVVLRIGGDSASKAVWKPNQPTVPAWAVELTPAWLTDTSALVRASRARLILDLNVVTASPVLGAQWARAAEAALPAGSIAGFEIGNEPDLYSRRYWTAVVSGSPLYLPPSLTAADYARDFRAYAQALAAATPGVPLLGPAVANPVRHVQWIATLLASPHPGLQAVSAHRYPYSACARADSASYPMIARLLSEAATAGIAGSIEPAVRLAHRAGLPFRLTELNSVTCGGRPGVSDTFATALWAPDALFELLRAGVDAVDIHVRPGMDNAAFSLTGHGLSARPLLYGLILSARTLAPDSEVAPVQVHAGRSVRLKAWAVRPRSGGLRVLLINKGRQAVRVVLRLPRLGPASVGRLSAPSVSSRSGTTLDGQHLSVTGRWLGPARTERITPGAASYELTVARYSAALLETSTARR